MNVVVGLSGGIDSAIAAYLLKRKGYNVIGITMIHIDGFDIERVRYVARKLDIPLISVDIKEEFRKKIILPFIEEYKKGKTPNPCIMCNPLIKFGIIKMYAKRYGELFATGHYAKIEKREDKYFIKKGMDKKKDQSYFLYRLTQEDLKDILFPLGDYRKEEVKEIGEKILGILPKQESQDICFIKTTYQDFIKEYLGEVKEGDFVNTEGRIIGKHKGIPFYTIGQRRGLGISSTQRLYVVDILSKENKIILGPREELIKKEFTIEDVTSPSFKTIPEEYIYTIKVRYNTSEKKGMIRYLSPSKIRITLEEEEYAITPGQSAVLYRGEYLIGGGIISS